MELYSFPKQSPHLLHSHRHYHHLCLHPVKESPCKNNDIQPNNPSNEKHIKYVSREMPVFSFVKHHICKETWQDELK